MNHGRFTKKISEYLMMSFMHLLQPRLVKNTVLNNEENTLIYSMKNEEALNGQLTEFSTQLAYILGKNQFNY